MQRCTKLIPVLLALGCSHHQLDQAAPLRAREGYVAGAGGVRLYYRFSGAGLDTVVVLHGGPGFNLEGLRPDLEPLGRHHVLLFYDQRGSGHSTLPDTLSLTLNAMVEDLEAVRRAFRLERLTLLGHSWGGGLAPLYAVRYPDRVARMVLVGPISPRGEPYLPEYGTNQAARRDSAETRRMAELDSLLGTSGGSAAICREWTRTFLRGVAGVPEHAKRIKGDYCAGSPDHLGRLSLVTRRVLSSLTPAPPWLAYDWRSDVARLSIPTLVLQGTDDPLPLASAEEWVAILPEARLVAIPGAGHYPHAETPELFFPPVEVFLRGEWPAGSTRPVHVEPK
jgi:proline iminopeptidase